MRPTIVLAAIATFLFTLLVDASPHQTHLAHHRKKPCGIGRCDFHPSESPKCWGDYSVETNWYREIPDTGVTREYWFEIRNGTAAVDGVERVVLTVNGTVPGPTIEADWGDNIIVHVRNALADNGTSIHWHGLRQHHTTGHDGVASVTQCPLAPGDGQTYAFRAAEYGHSWYHSHFSLQAWNGVVGAIVVRGPCTAPYDEDAGVVMLSDWFHNTTDALWAAGAAAGSPPAAQNGLINGMNVYGDGGRRFETRFTAGKRHRLRLVNAAMDTHFKFSVDGHRMTVMAADFVPVRPYTTDVLSIGIGQRYDVVVEAEHTGGDFWMRAVPAADCSAENERADDIRGIVRYDAVSRRDPTSAPHPHSDDCLDEPMARLVPYLALDAERPAATGAFSLGYTTTTTTNDTIDAGQSLFKWTLDGQAFQSDWGAPTLRQSLAASAASSTSSTASNAAVSVSSSSVSSSPFGAASSGVVQLRQRDAWAYFVIENPAGALGALSHPVHLHGHDFWVLAQEANATYRAAGDGNEEEEETKLALTNPPRRDVAMLPANGYLVIGFVTDNPGTWLMHCHIGWHASQGLALQIVEREPEIPETCDSARLDSVCANWNNYVAARDVVQDDSGI
ncbi:putative multicopper oxidase [Xylariaceae sp. FL0804]|nr:putative multicopper oxidase [Xylariaceae sp. FL0804]